LMSLARRYCCSSLEPKLLGVSFERMISSL
jgi:hypothetical protein